MELKRTISDSRDMEYSVWAVPVSFCALRYINGPLSREKDREVAKREGVRHGKPNEQFTASRNA